MGQADSIKCLVWDLDDTLWQGILLEDEDVVLRPAVVGVIQTLDQRGILQSTASRGEHGTAMRKLQEFGLHEYFLYPQIHWGPKSTSIRAIAESLNIGLEAIAFIDDQAFERDEVKALLPQVTCIPAERLLQLLDMPCMNPLYVTDDSRRRRLMYLGDLARKEAKQQFEGPQEEFLASLGMVLTIFPAREEDLRRAEELTVRTNQMNATGVTYSYEELRQFRRSDRHILLMARLEDKYGTYGHIALALIERSPALWTIRLLLTSCRVMSRGVGSVLLVHILHQAKEQGVRLQAHFVPNERNRIMHVTYRFARFREAGDVGGVTILEHDLLEVPPYPDYMTLVVR